MNVAPLPLPSLVALMVPSTLRVYLSKTTPAEVKNRVLERLENGERVSRSHLHSAVAAERSRATIVSAPARNRTELVGSTNELVIGSGIIAAGVVLYFLSRRFRERAEDKL